MENKVEKAYNDVLKVLKKHKDIICFDVDNLETKAKLHLLGVELKEKHKLNIDPVRINRFDWNKFGEHMSVGNWGDKYKRTISSSDNDRQPKDELLLQISFPTGAFIFGDGGMFNKDYPIEFFKKFWAELKTYNPKYIDSKNSSLYFSMENANNIFNKFNDILNKYHLLNDEDIKQRRILKMKNDLAELEAQS